MTTMSVSGKRVYTENVETGVARRGLWRGKSRMVPTVLLSALLVVTGGFVVTGGAEAQAASGGGTLEISESQAKLEVRTRSYEHVFNGVIDLTGHSLAGLKPPGTWLFLGGLEFPDYKKLINETKTFEISQNPGSFENLRIDFYDINRNRLGFLNGSFVEGGIKVDDLIPVPISGIGEWNPKIVPPPPPPPPPVNPGSVQVSVAGVVETDSKTLINFHLNEPKSGIYSFDGFINGFKYH